MTAALGNPFVLGAGPTVQTSARTDRLSLGATFRPSSAALGVVSGCLAGPANTMGELTLLTDVLVRVAPFVAVVQGTHNSTQGQYVVPNGMQRDLAVPAKNASSARRALVIIRVADSLEAGVATSASTDGAWLEVLSGTLAASNPTLPALPANSLALGELSIPSVSSGLPVTLTRYNPRTTQRGAILPVVAGASTVPGNAGAPGLYAGEYRDHPDNGLERWSGAAWLPAPAGRAPTNPTTPGMGALPGARPLHVWRDGRTVHLGGTGYLNGTVAQTGGRLLLCTVDAEFRPPAASGYLVLPGAIVNGWLAASLEVHPDGRVILRNDGANGGYSGNGNAGSFVALATHWSAD